MKIPCLWKKLLLSFPYSFFSTENFTIFTILLWIDVNDRNTLKRKELLLGSTENFSSTVKALGLFLFYFFFGEKNVLQGLSSMFFFVGVVII